MLKSIVFSCILLLGVNCFAQHSIFDAARSGDTSSIKALHVENKDTINAVDDDGHSPLILAAYRNHYAAVKLLLDLGAKIDYSFSQGSALHGAVYKGNKEIVELLLQYKAKVNTPDNNGSTPLIYATLFKHVEIAKLLFKKGADHLAKDSTGQSAKDYATSLQIKELITLYQ